MSKPVRLIKKYPNRRLYDTETSSYITLSEVKQLVLGHQDFQVVDAKTNQDLTRSILMQIILEEEAGMDPLFTCDMLSQMIRSYGNAMQGFMGNYLEKGIQSFVDIQKKLQEQSAAVTGGSEPPSVNADVWKQFLNAQGPALQGLMGNYLEQSTQLFMEMQNQMQRQARTMFGGFPFPYGTPAAPSEPASKEPSEGGPKTGGPSPKNGEPG
ncbi:MAG: polyhydroxyalkanoate synthesis repressor PhaR [Betaproteobacteria bacterium]|nr:polyhydroxyalkanoate synthesis repressor PhaR [Betaproteobacteria bacterium]MDE2131502.1 polyhydroxyalkanoate synthesis repressor PhaR [Betaproteobacteria bacterium]MDE2211901.1 polyhydroxyalkanoate synthesis repressor PhaR [Betaproteobacteria bacterium]